MNFVSPSLVTESVTIVPGRFCSSFAEISAISLLRFISSPFLSTAPARSTSVSNIMPRSALFLSTASFNVAMAPLSSGLGA